jgi:hypothetical protein
VFGFYLQVLSETFLITGRNERSMKKSILVFVKITRYSCQILMKFEFSRQIFKNTLISNLMKIGPLGAEVFHTDGRTDMTKLIVPFHNFANVLNKSNCNIAPN